MLDDLIGYALSALEASDRARVAALVEADREWRRRLESLCQLLQPLEILREHVAAPPGLAVRTCVRVLATRGPAN